MLESLGNLVTSQEVYNRNFYFEILFLNFVAGAKVFRLELIRQFDWSKRLPHTILTSDVVIYAVLYASKLIPAPNAKLTKIILNDFVEYGYFSSS